MRVRINSIAIHKIAAVHKGISKKDFKITPPPIMELIVNNITSNHKKIRRTNFFPVYVSIKSTPFNKVF